MPISYTERIRRLSDRSDDELFTAIGASVRSEYPEPDELAGLGLDSLEPLAAIGRDIYRRISRELNALICGANATDQEREKLMRMLSLTDNALCAGLTGFLVSSFGLSVEVAGILSILLLRLIIRPGRDALCEYWSSTL